MHFGLSDEQEMIVSTVRSFVENEIYPHHQGQDQRIGFLRLQFSSERRWRWPKPCGFRAG